MIFDRDAER